MEDKWGREAAEKLRRRVELKDIDNAVLLEKRRLLNEQAPALWQEVRDSVIRLVDQLNSDYGDKVVTVLQGAHDDLSVQLRIAGTMSELRATFNATSSPEALKWSYVGPAAQSSSGGSWSLQIKDGVVVFLNAFSPAAPEELAKKMLDGLLKG